MIVYLTSTPCLPLWGRWQPEGLTERVVSTKNTLSVTAKAVTAIYSGMIATGNHYIRRFAALCSTPKGRAKVGALNAHLHNKGPIIWKILKNW